MPAAVTRACQYEWPFWDGAYPAARLAVGRLIRNVPGAEVRRPIGCALPNCYGTASRR